VTPVILEDQTLRDGLQGEPRLFSLEEKLRLLEGLIAAGFKRIQLGSLVNPKRVPQMADTDELVRRTRDRTGVVFTALVLNAKGLERALGLGVRHVAMSVSVSEAHSRRNVGRPAEEALVEMAGLIERAAAAGLTVRAGLQCAFGCVYQGRVDPAAVLHAAQVLGQAGAAEINLSDTTGMAQPYQVKALAAETARLWPGKPLILHLHDTRGLGLANLLAGFEAGVRIFDVCAGGLGGCPFVKGAAGNVAAEDVVHLLGALGQPTGIDLGRLAAVVDDLEALLGRPLPGKMGRVLKATCQKEG
jgi:hydroxymethylglutaryl-CoA lyase